jgi:hypothetical protein
MFSVLVVIVLFEILNNNGWYASIATDRSSGSADWVPSFLPNRPTYHLPVALTLEACTYLLFISGLIVVSRAMSFLSQGLIQDLNLEGQEGM